MRSIAVRAWCILVTSALLAAAGWAEPRIAIEGNDAFSARRLMRAMRAKQAAALAGQDSLRAMLERLAGFYRANGYVEARAEYIRLNTGTDSALVRIIVEEGPRYLVAQTDFEGNRTVPEKLLLAAVHNRPGRPFNPEAVGGDEFQLMMAYADRGFIYAAVDDSIELTGSRVSMTYRIDEGRRVRISEVKVAGAAFARPEAVLRTAGIKSGDWFSRKRLLEGELALRRMDLFAQASVQPGAISADSGSIGIDVEVREKPRRWWELGLGYGSGDAFRVMTGWANRNVRGDGQKLELNGFAAVQLWKYVKLVRARAGASYREPWLLGLDLPVEFSAYYDDYRPPYSDYRLQTVGLDADLLQRTGPRSSIDWKLSQQWLRLSPNWRDPLYPSDTISYHGRRSAAFAWEWSQIDDPILPQRGISWQLEGNYTGGMFRGFTTFQRLVGTILAYQSIRKPAVNLALRARGGVIGDWAKRHQVPHYDKFFMGGPTTLRGYSNGMAGPMSDLGAPLGGTNMALANLEVRPRIYRQWLASVFIDVGILTNNHLRKMSLSEAYTSPGAGARYVLPIGTGRLDFACPGTKMDKIKYWKVIVAWGEIF